MFGTLALCTGKAVVYSRGTNSLSITAVPGRSAFSQDEGNGMTTEFTSSDWIILASSLVLGGSVVLPQRNDRVTQGTQVFEVLSPPYAPSNPEGTLIRIHSKRIA